MGYIELLTCQKHGLETLVKEGVTHESVYKNFHKTLVIEKVFI
jgi:hypothetical protein